jgi:hypothetical protein
MGIRKRFLVAAFLVTALTEGLTRSPRSFGRTRASISRVLLTDSESNSEDFFISRRVIFRRFSAALSLLSVPRSAYSATEPRSIRPTSYSIIETDPPQMQPFTSSGEQRIISEATKQSSAILIGSHGTREDDFLEANLIVRISQASERPIVISLSSIVQSDRTQKALDDYVSKNNNNDVAAEDTLRNGVDSISVSSVVRMLPVLRTAREIGAKVVAAGLDSQVVTQVRTKGLEALGSQSSSFSIRSIRTSRDTSQPYRVINRSNFSEVPEAVHGSRCNEGVSAVQR